MHAFSTYMVASFPGLPMFFSSRFFRVPTLGRPGNEATYVV